MVAGENRGVQHVLQRDSSAGVGEDDLSHCGAIESTLFVDNVIPPDLSDLAQCWGSHCHDFSRQDIRVDYCGAPTREKRYEC